MNDIISTCIDVVECILKFKLYLEIGEVPLVDGFR